MRFTASRALTREAIFDGFGIDCGHYGCELARGTFREKVAESRTDRYITFDTTLDTACCLRDSFKRLSMEKAPVRYARGYHRMRKQIQAWMAHPAYRGMALSDEHTDVLSAWIDPDTDKIYPTITQAPDRALFVVLIPYPKKTSKTMTITQWESEFGAPWCF